VADDSYDSGNDPETALGEGDGEDADKADEKLLEEAKARFELAEEAEKENRKLGDEDCRFRAGDQWPADIKTSRQADGRPCLTINKMPQFEQQVTNDQRQNRPSIKVHGVDDKSDPKTAKIYQGLIKHIEVSSNADTARDTAFENAVRRSYGYYRVVTEYVDESSFNQEIRVKRIRDPNTVLLDPDHQEPDGSDMEWGFIYEWMTKDRYRAEYGESRLANASDWDIECAQAPDWLDRESVLVAEYFYKEYTTKHLALLSDGQVMEMAEAQEFVKNAVAQPVDEDGMAIGDPAPTVTIIDDRKARIPSVKWCKLNGTEILSKTNWPGKWIPILPVYGAELVVDGKLVRESLIRHAKDPARMYNFWKSSETEAITLAPKSPYVADAKSIEGYEAIWSTANRKNHSYLPYNARPDVPMPQRQSTEANVQAITQASMLAADEIKQTLGIYDASLGAKSNETSGIAIQRRNQQAQTSNFHFTDNLNRTIRHEGRIHVDLIPHVYNTARAVRILGEDGETEVVRINEQFKHKGEEVFYDMGVGQYDVTMDTGPSYATRRQEAGDAMLELSKSMPVIGQAAPDLVLKTLDVPGASELAERIKKTLPPGLADDPKDKKPLPPQVQAQMAQMGQMIDAMTKELHSLHDERDQKRIELESKERIEMAKIQADLEIAMAKLGSQESIELLRQEIAQIEGRLALLNYSVPIDDESQEMAAPQPTTAPNESAMPSPAGAPGAQGGEGMAAPTGGDQPPGLPMDEESTP
jgi:hypothetical protein